jgi:hypothetical protein
MALARGQFGESTEPMKQRTVDYKQKIGGHIVLGSFGPFLVGWRLESSQSLAGFFSPLGTRSICPKDGSCAILRRFFPSQQRCPSWQCC